MNRRRPVAAIIALGGVMAFASWQVAEAQRIDPRRPKTLVVGAPAGGAAMQRVDARRTGFAKTSLPTGTLTIAWRKSTGLTLDQPALVTPDGWLAVVSVRGDVTFFDEGGDEKGIVKVGGSQVSAAAVTSDGTIVFMTSGGEAIGVKRTSAHPHFATRIGGERGRGAPLALDDGGVVLTTTTDLVVLDAEGNVRSRVTLPESPISPLVSAGDKILAVTSTGAVFGWTPGREPIRLGSFGAPIDGAAALVDGQLVAVIEGNHLAAVDVARGGRATRSIAPQGLYMGPPAIRPVQGGENTTVLALTQTRGFVVTVDPSGQEALRAPIASINPQPLPDGGLAPLVAPPHTGVLVDGRGTIAWASTDGHVGIVSPDGAVDTIGEALCVKGARSGVVGLTPFGNGGFVVTCEGGLVARIASHSSDSLRGPPPSPAGKPSATAPSERLRPGPRDPD